MAVHATALFADRHAAHVAVEQLVQAGFARDAISVVMSEDTHEREYGDARIDKSGVRPARYVGVLGTIVSGLVAHSASDGPRLRVGGPLVTALVQAGALMAALVAVGLAEQDAHAVHRGLRLGSIVVGVHGTGERARVAMKLLALAGGDCLQAA
jgi:hypothetical protein